MFEPESKLTKELLDYLGATKVLIKSKAQFSYKDHLPVTRAALQDIGVQYFIGTDSYFIYVPNDVDIVTLSEYGASDIFITHIQEMRRQGIPFIFVKGEYNG